MVLKHHRCIFILPQRKGGNGQPLLSWEGGMGGGSGMHFDFQVKTLIQIVNIYT